MAKAFKKHSQRTIDRINILVRLELANPTLSLMEVAQLAGIKQTRFAIIRANPLYTQIKNRYMTGLLTKLDHQVSDNYKLSKSTLEFAVPLALQGLVKQAISSSDERVRNKACNDILDREGSFAKVTRMKLQTTVAEKQAGDEKDQETANELAKALAANKPSTSTPDITDQDIATDLIQ